jgi:hypothetical protein
LEAWLCPRRPAVWCPFMVFQWFSWPRAHWYYCCCCVPESVFRGI